MGWILEVYNFLFICKIHPKAEIRDYSIKRCYISLCRHMMSLPKMCTYVWKKWKVFSHSSSGLFFSTQKNWQHFFLLLTEKHRISTKTWRNYCFVFTMKQSFLFYGDVMLRDTLSKLLWITCYTQKITKSYMLHKV